MRNIVHYFIPSLLVIILLASSAQAACTLTTRSGSDIPSGKIVTGTISPSPLNVRMPKDIATGTVIYRITAREQTHSYYRPNCNNSMNSSNYYTKGQFIGAVPSVAPITSSLGTVYQTGIAGIGFVVLTGYLNKKLGEKTYFPSPASNYCETRYPTRGCATFARDADITYILVKTGEISGNSIDLALLPAVESVTGGENSPGTDIVIFRPSLAGVITFTQPTCALAEKSKTIKLGSHPASGFTAATPATAWVDASINLINCNHGGTQGYAYDMMGYSNSPVLTQINSPNTSQATWNLTLTPATTIISDASGIMEIDTSIPNSAAGVGIQLATTNTASPNLVKFSQPVSGTMVSGINQTMKLPLFARYIKTDTSVAGGKANGKVTYTIEYK